MMKTNMRRWIIVLGLAILTSLACSLVTQALPEAPPALDEAAPPAITEEAATQGDDPASTEETAPPAPAADENSVTSGDGLVPPPPAGGGACANTFYPLIPGNQWIYEITSEGETSQISLTVSEVNGNQATLNTLYLESGVTSEATVECQDGAILNFPIVMLAFLFGDVDGELEVTHEDGVFVPNYQTFSQNHWDLTWTSDYVTSGEIQAEIEGEMVTGRLEDSPLRMTWNTLGSGNTIFESITVKAGSYPQAIKLERQVEFDFTAEMVEQGQTISLAAVLILENDLWFEPNVGLLRQEIAQASAKVYGINFPIVMDGSVELVEFRTGE